MRIARAATTSLLSRSARSGRMVKKSLALVAALALLIAPAVAEDTPAADPEDDAGTGPYAPMDHGEETQDSPGLGAGLLLVVLIGLVLNRRR